MTQSFFFYIFVFFADYVEERFHGIDKGGNDSSNEQNLFGLSKDRVQKVDRVLVL